MAPRVTWLLPVRDGMPYLPETLASIEAQTFRDFEVLAWDNGSKDGSGATLRDWIPGRLPGRVVTDAPFPRLGGCLRAMVREARSELVARIDADDVNEPERLARQVVALDRHPAWLGVGSWIREIDSEGRPGARLEDYACDPPGVRWDAFFHNPLPHPTACLRREAVLRAGSYTDQGVGQDWDLWIRMLLCGELGLVAAALVRYRVHPHSVSAGARAEWSELGRGIAETYAERLFPGVERDVAMSVWRFLSLLSPERGRRPAPSPRAIYELARAGAMAAGWGRHALAALPRTRRQLLDCVRADPRRLADWLVVRHRLLVRSA
jgi:glycosyltransferase involved in cell wall biosynthesis